MTTNEEAAGGGERPPTPATQPPVSAIEVVPVKLAGIAPVREAVAWLANQETPFENRAALFAALHGLQLEINRVLRVAKGQLAYRMFKDGIAQAGQLRLKHVPRKVVYRVNEEPAWTHDEVQAALRGLRNDPLTRSFVTFIPAHLEINPVTLAAALHGQLESPESEGRSALDLERAARGLYREMKQRRWRVELEGEETIEVVPKPIDRPEAPQ